MTASSTDPVILVVDDESIVRDMARRILETDQYRVIEASNGIDALRILKDETSIDLLFADLEMPELAGEEMARQFKAARPDLKVLYVSGVIDRLLDQRPVLWDGEAFLSKPFTAEGLLEAVAMILYGTVARTKSR
jgi:two-component system cell cycle sensor histidine kinase/response regulator CckA